MTAIPIRPRVLVPAVPVLDWDGGRGLYVATCHRCTETFESTRLSRAHEWAEAHRCDPELAALLEAMSGRQAA